MRDVAVIGIGQTPIGEHWDLSLRELAAKAVQDAANDAGIETPDALYVSNMLAPRLSDQAHLGALIADYAGWRGIEATLQLSQSTNSKVVIIGSAKDGLPLILGNMDASPAQGRIGDATEGGSGLAADTTTAATAATESQTAPAASSATSSETNSTSGSGATPDVGGTRP